MNLVCAAKAQSLDKEAMEHWGFNHAALVESAGRACAQAFIRTYNSAHSSFLIPHSLMVFVGKGSNAADALVMLRTLILDAYVKASACSVFTAFTADESSGLMPLLSDLILSVQKLGVPVLPWNSREAADVLAGDIVSRGDVSSGAVIIDGILGTGLTGPLRNAALNMTETINSLRRDNGGPRIVSIDVPSGSFDGWQPGMPIVAADITLAIEPQKLCLYTPSARPYAGTIIPVGGIFPPSLTEKYSEARLIGWEDASAQIPLVPKNAHKYGRGLVEIRAGSPGAAGAARLAALGAQAAGAGLVRLIVDSSLYPVIASSCSGVMVDADDGAAPGGENRFSVTAHSAAAVLLGPGWGRGADRMRLLQSYLPLEEQGIPLILDADAIALAKDMVFHGNVILTPHPGEFAAYTGLPRDQILANPVPALCRFAAEKKVNILFKGHVLYIVSPEGQIGIIDGMNPVLAAGGSGDVLAGFCASIAARGKTNLWHCVCAAASLLLRAAESDGIKGRFVDPEEIAHAASSAAGAAWLTEMRP